MSDFGAYIEILKKDGKDISPSDKETLDKAVERIKENGEFSDSLGEDFLFNISESEGDNNRLLLILSEYWNGEGDDEENFEFAQDNDLVFAQDIAELLTKELGDTFSFETKFENW